MALQMTLSKDHNHIGCDFPQAYWRIEDINVGNTNGDAVVVFKLIAYPNREASHRLGQPVPSMTFGSPYLVVVENALYAWVATFPAHQVFPSGIPFSEAGQRAHLYPFVKAYLNLVDAIDVLEEE